MNIKKLHITILFFLIWRFSFAQEIKNYTIKNGLPSNHVYRITQDLDGFIWIITDKGIAKFNGKNFKLFTTKNGLPTNDIWDLKITKDNKKHFFSKSNKQGYIKNDSIFSFSSINNNVLFPRIISKHNNTVAFSDGKNFFYLKDTIWQKSIIKNAPIIYKDTVKKFNRKGNSLFIEEKYIGQQNKEIHNNVLHTGQINDSLYTIISHNNFLIVNLNNFSVHNYSFNSQKLTPYTKYVRYHDVNNSVQITGMNFLGFLNKKGEIKKIRKIPKKYNSHFSFIDKSGNTWLATFNNGIYFIPNQKVKTIAKNQKVQFLKHFNNKTYVGIYQKGLYELKKDTLLPIIKNSNFQYGIFNNNNRSLLYSTNNNAYRLQQKKQFLINTNIANSFKNTLFRKIIYFKNKLYGNSFDNINKINSTSFKIEKQYPLFGVTSFCKNLKSLFVTSQGGLFSIQNDSLIKLTNHAIFSKPIINSANFNNDKVVIGTDGYGAYLTNGNEVIFIKGTEERSIENIYIDNDKNIWFASEKGVYKAQKSKNKYIVTQKITDDDGLVSNKTNDVLVKNDSLFVATNIGISIININEKPSNNLLGLYIESFTANNKPITNNKFKYKNNNQLSTTFNAINFRNHNNLEYSYKLTPIQTDFININTPEINFSNLNVGNYKLYLRVKNNYQHEKLKSIEFKITPLWYQTLLFKILATLLCMTAIYLTYKWNTARIKKEARKKAEIKQKLAEQELYALRSQMNPHFVFNSLNAIQYYITQNQIHLSEKYLVRFSKLIRMFFDFSAQKSITIAQEIKLLDGYLDIEKMRFGKEFNYKINRDKNLNAKMHIPTMILQPIVENAVNHGIFHNNQKGTVTINFNYISPKEYCVTVIDNGIGIKKALEIKETSLRKHTSRSTKILQNRINLINQSNLWKISYTTEDLSAKNKKGTQVTLKFEQL